MKKIIIYDSDHPGALQNKCFEPSYASQGSGHGFTVELAKRAKARDFEILTADIFLKREYPEARIFCVTDMYSANTDQLISRGAIPIICFSTESPIIARDFYVNIKKLAGRFMYNFQFKGTAERLINTGTQFSVMYYPVDERTPLSSANWNDRKTLILVNRNKRIFYNSTESIEDIVRSVLSRVKVGLLKLIDPWVRSKEIYKDRIEAIYYFSKLKDFHLYGQGWEKAIPGFSKGYHEAAKKAFQGSIKSDEKLKVMNQYKFSICFENCVFPGYVTEKIFDCFLAACIPIYYGAPDIDDFVPADAYIDFRKFRSMEELEEYLNAFTEWDAKKMLDAAREFLSSKNFDRHYTSNVVDDFLDKIEKY